MKKLIGNTPMIKIYYKYNNEDMPIAIKMNIEKPRLSWLEIEIVKHCNMNCNGCSVCANISNAEYKDIESFERDMRQLKKYYSGIKVLKLFGGVEMVEYDLKMRKALDLLKANN